jgi:hypothetical protein
MNNKVATIVDLHHNQRKSISEIRSIIGCNAATIYKILKKHNIPIVKKVNTNENLLNDKQWLYNEYVINKRSLKDISKELKTSRWRLTEKLKEYEIDIKKSPVEKKENNFSTISLPPDGNIFYSGIKEDLKKYLSSYNFTFGKDYFVCEEKKIAIDLIESNVDREKNIIRNRNREIRNAGYNLIQFFDIDWKEKESICKSMIQNSLGVSDKIYARNCKVVKMDYNEVKNFINDSHLYGVNSSCSINYCLINNDEIVSCMSFNKSRYDSKIEYELIRFCNKLNTRVIGGASKIFSQFITDYNPNSIVSYCDNRYSTGNLYGKLGFSKISENYPNYFYVVSGELKSRQSYQKHKLKEKLIKFNSTYTEIQNMKLNGFFPLYDAGHLKYVWEK